MLESNAKDCNVFKQLNRLGYKEVSLQSPSAVCTVGQNCNYLRICISDSFRVSKCIIHLWVST